MTATLPAIHLAGNCAVDLMVPTASPTAGAELDSWSASLRILQEGPAIALAGGAGWPARQLARMGHAVYLNTSVGRDLFGSFLRDLLGEVGVELVGPERDSTAVSVLSAEPGGLRTGFMYPGEPISWRASAQPIRTVPRSHWFFASGYAGVSVTDFQTLKRLFAGLRERGVNVVFDPSPWIADRVEKTDMLELLSLVYCLSATEAELQAWFDGADAVTLSRGALNYGVQCVVVKQGQEGATFAAAGAAPEQVTTTPFPGANAVGAGDAFNAGVLHGLSTGMPLRDTVAFAVRIATEVVRVGRGVFDVTALP